MAKRPYFKSLFAIVLAAASSWGRADDSPFKPEWKLENLKLGAMREAPELFFFWKHDRMLIAQNWSGEDVPEYRNLFETIKAPRARRNDATLEYVDFPEFSRDPRASLVLPLSHAQYLAHGTVFRIVQFHVRPEMKNATKVLRVFVTFEQQSSMGGYPVKFEKFQQGLTFYYTTTVEWSQLTNFEGGTYFVQVGDALKDLLETLAPYKN